MTKSRKRILPNLLLLAVTLAATLAVAEVVARRVLPVDPYEIEPNDEGAEAIGVEHPTRGHALRPGFRGRFVHPDFGGEEVVTNSLGFRDGEPPPEKAGALHVTVLGDSITFGTGVTSHETFSALAEADLAGRLALPVRVFNTGVPGYGPLHELVVLREESAAQSPDVAAVAFYPGNDVQEIYTFYRQRGMLFDLLAQFPAAEKRAERPPVTQAWEIDGESRQVIFAHPDAEIRYAMQAGWTRRGAMLRFAVALRPDSWDKPGADGVRFEVVWEHEGQSVVLFNEHVDPNKAALRGWNERRVNLSNLPWEGATLVLRTSGEASLEHDQAGWAEPHIFVDGAGDVLRGARWPSRFLLQPAIAGYWQRVAADAGMSSRAYWERRSSLLRFVLGRLDNLAVRWRLKSPRAILSHQMIGMFDREMPESVRVGLDLTAKALAEMQAFMRDRGGRLVVLLVPTKFQTEPETVRRFAERAGLDPGRIDVEQPHRVVLEFCQRSSLTCVDLLPELRERVAAGERVYFPEGHPNRLGHRIIARRLAEAVESAVAASHQPTDDVHRDVSPDSKPSPKTRSP